MTRPLARLLIVLAPLAATGVHASSDPVRTDHLQSQLVAESTAAVPGSPLTLGLLLEHDPHWHTYWRNPGDSGLPTEIEFELPDGVVAGPIAWPHPHRFEVAEIVNYGYEGRRLLPVSITVPANYAATTLPIRAKADWLICEEECIPGKAEYAFELPVAASAEADPRFADDFTAARDDAPRAATTPLVIAEDGDGITFELADPAAKPAAWTWIPETPQVVANAAGPQWQRTDAGWRARWPKSDYFTAMPTEVVFVAVDEGEAGTTAWRYAGAATAAAPPPAASVAATADGAPEAASDAPTGSVFRWWPLLLFPLVAIAVAMVLRPKSPTRTEEIDR